MSSRREFLSRVQSIAATLPASDEMVSYAPNFSDLGHIAGENRNVTFRASSSWLSFNGLRLQPGPSVRNHFNHTLKLGTTDEWVLHGHILAQEREGMMQAIDIRR